MAFQLEMNEESEEDKPDNVSVEVVQKIVPDIDRRRFIIKTASLVLFMLVITVIFILLPLMIQPLREFILKVHPGVIWALYLLHFLMTNIISCCCFLCLFRSPLNYVVLVTYAVFSGVVLMALCVYYSIYAIIMAIAATIVCVLATIAFAIVCKKDLTNCWFIAFIVALSLSIMGVGAIVLSFFVPPTTFFWISMGLSFLLVLYFMFTLTMQIQSVIGGTNRKIVYCEQAYAVAAFSIYLEVFGLFVNLLNLTNLAR